MPSSITLNHICYHRILCFFWLLYKGSFEVLSFGRSVWVDFVEYYRLIHRLTVIKTCQHEKKDTLWHDKDCTKDPSLPKAYPKTCVPKNIITVTLFYILQVKLESEQVSRKQSSVSKKKSSPTNEVVNLLKDTTSEHNHHLFDSNCKICTGKMTPPGESQVTGVSTTV